MSNRKRIMADSVFTVLTLLGAFCLNLLLQNRFETYTMTPMIFVLGVFLVSWRTQGYGFGIASSLISVLAVNWAFTYPYWAFDLISPECISSAVVMLIVATLTGTLTTRLKQQEKLKAEAEKERMRGNLLRAVSHDLRTPLTSIYGSCSAIIENFDSIPREKQLKLLKDMQSDSQWLNRMVENLLSVTRVDADKVRLSKHSTVLEELIDALLVKFRKHYPQQKVHVRIPEEFVSIPMDPVLIEQVLMNLLENAVYHAHGMQNLWLEVHLHNNKAIFRIYDDGCGIPEDRTEESDKVSALDLGANDYITKPFGTAELVARVRAALRTNRHNVQAATPGGLFTLEDLVIDYDRRQVTVDGNYIHMTQTEYNILAFLSQHVGKVMTYSAIIGSIWGSMDNGSVKKLQVNMANIRKKLGCTPGENRYVINELGVGYRMLDAQE